MRRAADAGIVNVVLSGCPFGESVRCALAVSCFMVGTAGSNLNVGGGGRGVDLRRPEMMVGEGGDGPGVGLHSGFGAVFLCEHLFFHLSFSEDTCPS